MSVMASHYSEAIQDLYPGVGPRYRVYGLSGSQ
jgi:hypothetical protein